MQTRNLADVEDRTDKQLCFCFFFQRGCLHVLFRLVLGRRRRLFGLWSKTLFSSTLAPALAFIPLSCRLPLGSLL
ncbi:hypothetical protein BDW74DRAFT_161369 [Aspergillus multicolor]|uniref:uncharacterized protein n=1 Tax=Aspergillus multicolor TaxID=41759 RepID=UPI003CCD91AB